jgi:hypothetical protein
MARIYVEYSKFEKSTKLKLGKRFYNGNGEIFTIVGHADKLVKIVICDYKDEAQNMLKVFKYFKKEKSSAVVKLYDTGSFFYNDDCGTYPCYYYVMEKLKPLPKKGREALVERIDYYLNGVRVKPKEPKAVKNFVKKANKLSYSYGDFHGGNIMRAKNGSLKFVDLESFY